MGRLRLPSPSMVVSIVALVVACSGGAIAATVITSKEIKNGTIKLGDISSSARKSLAGSRGANGSAGATGARGLTGLAGPAGAAGTAGAAGAAGPPAAGGPPGRAGPAGAAGRAGAAGAAGAAGKDGVGDAFTTTDDQDLTFGGGTDVAHLKLPAGTWAVSAHVGGASNHSN